MEFKCSACDFRTNRRYTVERHVKKTNCNPDADDSVIKTVIEIIVDIKCNLCEKSLATQATLKRHVKICRKNKERLEIDNKFKAMQEVICDLQKTVNELEIKTKPNVINYIDNTINNNAYIINNYENTPRPSDEKISKIIIMADEAMYILLDYINEKHFTKPENMNLFISNRSKNNKLMNKRVDNKWIVVNKEYEINNVISDNETELDDWVNDNKKKYPNAAKAYIGYKNIKYEDDTQKQLKENIEMMLYNIRKNVVQ